MKGPRHTLQRNQRFQVEHLAWRGMKEIDVSIDRSGGCRIVCNELQPMDCIATRSQFQEITL